MHTENLHEWLWENGATEASTEVEAEVEAEGDIPKPEGKEIGTKYRIEDGGEVW